MKRQAYQLRLDGYARPFLLRLNAEELGALDALVSALYGVEKGKTFGRLWEVGEHLTPIRSYLGTK